MFYRVRIEERLENLVKLEATGKDHYRHHHYRGNRYNMMMITIFIK